METNKKEKKEKKELRGFEYDLKEIKIDAQKRFSLYKEVFDNQSGKLLLSYMEGFYTGEPDFTNDRMTYFNLGRKDVIRQIKTILSK